METEADWEKETDTETVNINSIKFHSNCSALIAILKTSPNKVVIMVPYKIDMGSDGNIMPIHIQKVIS